MSGLSKLRATARTFELFKSRNYTNVHLRFMVGVGWAYTCSSIVLVWPAHLNTTRTFVLSFLAFKSRNYTNGTYYDNFRVKAKGVIYERVHTDIGVYMRVHIIQRYDDTMKEKGEEQGERKERDIYI